MKSFTAVIALCAVLGLTMSWLVVQPTPVYFGGLLVLVFIVVVGAGLLAGRRPRHHSEGE